MECGGTKAEKLDGYGRLCLCVGRPENKAGNAAAEQTFEAISATNPLPLQDRSLLAGQRVTGRQRLRRPKGKVIAQLSSQSEVSMPRLSASSLSAVARSISSWVSYPSSVSSLYSVSSSSGLISCTSVFEMVSCSGSLSPPSSPSSSSSVFSLPT